MVTLEGRVLGEYDMTTAANAPTAAEVIQYVAGANANNFIPPAGPMISARAHVIPEMPI